jgi:hypothetical protein
MSNIVCSLLGHRRSARHARPSAGVWKSKCQVCGVRRERIAPGRCLPVVEVLNLGTLGRPSGSASLDL